MEYQTLLWISRQNKKRKFLTVIRYLVTSEMLCSNCLLKHVVGRKTEKRIDVM